MRGILAWKGELECQPLGSLYLRLGSAEQLH